MTLQDVKNAGCFNCNISHLNRLCAKVYLKPENVYELIEEYNGEADTHTRETIFAYISKKYDIGYDTIFDKWVNNN